MTFARHKDSPLLLWSESEDGWTTDADAATAYGAEQKPQLPADAVWIDEYEIREQEFAALILACREAGAFRSKEATILLAKKLRVEPRAIRAVIDNAQFVLGAAQSYTRLHQYDAPDTTPGEQMGMAAIGRGVGELSSEDYATAVVGALVEHRTERKHYRNKEGETCEIPWLGIIVNCEFQDTDDPDIVVPVLEVHWEGDDFTRTAAPDAVVFYRQHLTHLDPSQPLRGRRSWFTRPDPASTPHRLTLLNASARKKQKLYLDQKLYTSAVRHALVEHQGTGKLGLVLAVSVDSTGAHGCVPLLRVQWEDEPEPQEMAAKDLRFHRELFQHLEIDQKLSLL